LSAASSSKLNEKNGAASYRIAAFFNAPDGAIDPLQLLRWPTALEED